MLSVTMPVNVCLSCAPDSTPTARRLIIRCFILGPPWGSQRPFARRNLEPETRNADRSELHTFQVPVPGSEARFRFPSAGSGFRQDHSSAVSGVVMHIHSPLRVSGPGSLDMTRGREAGPRNEPRIGL